MRTHLLSITAQYRQNQDWRSWFQLGVTVSLLSASYAGGMFLMQRSVLLGVIAAPVAALFIVRLFMIQHDCGHRSFLHSSRANDLLGSLLGIITMTPYRCWRRFHARHHVTSGNLDQRGLGDIHTLTTEEFEALSPKQQFQYRLYRHPLVLLVIGPPLLFILRQRTTYKVPREWKIERRSVHLTNLGIVGLLLLLCAVYDPMQVLRFHLIMMSYAAIVGVWLFYVQHQFPDAYWKRENEWVPWRASMEGATYYELPAVLRWLTANIGLHHIHHLDSRIPNYRLYECYKRHPEFRNSPRLTLRESLVSLRLRLWDEKANRMVPLPAR
jgi:omega-6 fatty acid desaturase (delta-12 desaturase)